MSDDTATQWSLRRGLLLLTLIGLGLLANVLAPRLFTGFNYLFGSIFTMLVLRLYGIVPAVIAALISGTWCQVLFGHSTALVWLGIEPIFVGLWLRRRPQGSMILADVVYWPLVGMPLLFLFFRYLLQVPLLGTTTAALMYMLIGITNALLATILYSYLPFERWSGSSRQRPPIPLHQLLFHLLMVAILVPAILLMVMGGHTRERYHIQLLIDTFAAGAGRCAFELRNSFFKQGLPATITRNSLSAEDRHRLATKLFQIKAVRTLDLSIVDRANGVLASTNPSVANLQSYDPFAGGIQRIATSAPDTWRRLPANSPPVPLWQRASRSSYVRIQPIPGTDLRLIYEAPFAPYQAQILKGHRNSLFTLLLYLFAVTGLATVAARSIAGPLQQLSLVTTDLPQRLQNGAAIAWPQTTIAEVAQLSDNAANMARQLSDQFHQIAEAKHSLEQRVAERTDELSSANASLQIEIEERIKAERQRDHLMDELVHQLRFLQSLLDAIPTPVYYKDISGIYQGCNQAFAAALGQQRETIVGKAAEDVYPAETASIYRAADDALFTGGGLQRYETDMTYSDGAMHTIILNKALYHHQDGTVAGLIGVFADITERKQAEEQRDRLMVELEAKNKELEGIIYVASHDLRSPLVNIQGFSRKLTKHCHELEQLVAQLQLPEELHGAIRLQLAEQIPRALGFIIGSTEKMDALLNGLLRLSRLGRSSLTIENLDMNALMGKIIDSLAFQIDSIKAEVRVEPLLPCRGDAVQVSQIFSNLLENALKYRDPDRPLRIEVTSIAYREGVHYCVQDNGLGIPAEQQSQVWEIFNRLNPRDIPGEGLGLTMARRIVDRLRGAVWLESEPGVGSQFYVMLPAVRS